MYVVLDLIGLIKIIDEKGDEFQLRSQLLKE